MANDKVDLHNDKPYPGPVPFQRKDQPLFFGREHEADELVSLITAHPIVLLYSQSGAGKTSLLNAGLIPLLERLEFKVVGPARVRGQIPGGFDYQRSNPYLYNALHTIPGDSKSSTLSTLRDYLRATLPTDSEGQLRQSSVVVLDQFEELFTLNPELWQYRGNFFEQVGEALSDPNLRVLFVMREDFIAEMDPYEALLPEKLRTRFRLERLRQPAALAAIKGPLGVEPWKALNREYGEGVAETLVQNLCQIPNKTEIDGSPLLGEFIEPVQLQVVCQAIWEKLESTDREITHDHLQRFGDVNQALTVFYEDCLQRTIVETNKKRPKNAPELHEGTLRGWFDRELITETGKRGTVFRGVRETCGIPNDAVDELEARHIIRAELRDGERWYELSHDRFLQPIKDSYKRWLLEQPGSEQTRLRLEEKAAAWFAAGKDASLLLDAGEVLEARRWLDSPEAAGIAYSDRLLAFVIASEAAIQRAERERERELATERQRRMKQMRLGLIGMGVLLILMTAVTAFAFSQRRAALTARAEAESERSNAMNQRDIAQKARDFAEERRVEAEDQKQKATSAQKEAETQKELAEASQAKLEVAAVTATAEARAARSAETEATTQRNLAQSRVIASVASNLLSQPFSDPEVVALLGLEAVNLAPSDQALDVLRNSMTLLTRSRTKVVASQEGLTAAAFSPDGDRLVTAGFDDKVRIWDKGGLLLKELKAAELPIRSPMKSIFENAVFSPDGRFVVAVRFYPNVMDKNVPFQDFSRKVVVWNSQTLEVVSQLDLGIDPMIKTFGEVERKQKHDIVFSSDGKRMLIVGKSDIRAWETGTWRMIDGFPVTPSDGKLKSAVLSPDGNYALLQSDNGHLKVRDLVLNKEVGDINSTGIAAYASFSFNNKMIALPYDNGSMGVWSIAGKSLLTYAGESELTSVAFSHNGQLIIVGRKDGTAEVRPSPTDTSERGKIRLSGHTGPIVSELFSPNDDLVLTASEDGTARIWDPATGVSLAELRGHTGAVTAANFSGDGSTIVSASADGTARVWSTVGDSGILPVPGKNAVFSPDGQYFATALDEGIAVWDAKTGKRIRILNIGWRDLIGPMFDGGGRLMLTHDESGLDTACVRNALTGAKTATLKRDRGSIIGGGLSPDGRLAVLYGSEDPIVSIFDVATERLVASFELGDEARSAVFSPDGRSILTTGNGQVELWNAQTGVRTRTLAGGDAHFDSAAFSPDGRFAVAESSEGSGPARVWDVNTGQTLASVNDLQDEATAAMFSPNSNYIVAAGKDSTARVFEWRTGRVVVLAKHTGIIRAVQFSHDGSYLVTASADGTARVWSTATWKSVAVLRGHKNEVLGATFGGPDGKSILTWSSDGTSRMYPPEMYATLDELKTLAPQRIKRSSKELTADERRLYLSGLELSDQAQGRGIRSK